MTRETIPPRTPAIHTLKQEIVGACDPQIMRIVATVDAMMRRGPADQLIEPLRQRLATLRPPRPLRFGRLLFFPLDLLIVPAARWRSGQQAIPRTALMPMAEHVRLAMGTAATQIEAEISGHTTADTELISRLGRSLWPAAASILAATATSAPAATATMPAGRIAPRGLVERAVSRPSASATIFGSLATTAMTGAANSAAGAPATAISVVVFPDPSSGAAVSAPNIPGRLASPAISGIAASTALPSTWHTTELSDALYAPLASIVATLLAEAAPLDRLWSDTATGLLPPAPAVVAAIFNRVARADQAALPMMIAMLLDRLPAAAGMLPAAQIGQEAAATHAAMDAATDLLLRQLDQEDGTETRIAAGTLADAGAAVGRIATLLRHLESANPNPRRRERLRSLRQRAEASCKARFASGLQDELLAPLQHPGIVLDSNGISALESAARGLRVLEAGGRGVGSGSAYDLLLGEAADAIKGTAMQDRLTLPDQIRLVEILSGPEAALAMLEHPPRVVG